MASVAAGESVSVTEGVWLKHTWDQLTCGARGRDAGLEGQGLQLSHAPQMQYQAKISRSVILVCVSFLLLIITYRQYRRASNL